MNQSLLRLVLVFTSFLGVVTIAAEPAPGGQPAAAKKVMEVESVTVKTVGAQPARLTIEAAGMVNSGGWKRPELVPVKSDAEGVLVFHFVAIPPDGPATQALVPVKASIRVEKPANFREVRVVAQTNSKTAK